jgi:anti-sigma regulatory factor (Ser/Thr protein kinase)
MDEAALTNALLEIADSSWVGESRRIAARIAEREGMPAGRAADAAVVVSELATNLLKHAQKGLLQIAPLSARGQPAGVEILAIDRGPGIANLPASFLDGHSTAGTAGGGLGAIRRLSSDFDVYSQPGKGTVIVSQIFSEKIAVPPSFRVGVTARPLAGEPVSGDAWAIRVGETAALLMIADGLGHGVLAAEASTAATLAFQSSGEQSPERLVELMHRALRGTRGAAVAVARVDFEDSCVRFAGLGNVAGAVATAGKWRAMVSHNGTAGHEARRVREFLYPWNPESVIVMHSDGLSTNWNLAAFPGLTLRHPSAISGVLYREAARDRDDACVIVGKRR